MIDININVATSQNLAGVATLILAPGLLPGQAGVPAEAGGGQVRTEAVAV